MYVSTSFGTTTAEAVDFLSQAVFGDLVSVGPDGLTSTPLPLLYEPAAEGDGLGTVVMHLARNNDHWQHADGQEGLLIVRGLNGYVHPGWYPSKAEHGRVVPTWDYEVAHVRGRLAVHDDVEWLARAVRSLTERHELRSTASLVGRGCSAEVHRGSAAGHRRPRAGGLGRRAQGQDEPEPPGARHRRRDRGSDCRRPPGPGPRRRGLATGQRLSAAPRSTARTGSGVS